MAEMYLVRHGQASFGSENYDQLSALGEQQAIWLGEYFAERGIQFDRLVTGTQLRHQQTAEGIAKGMGASLTPDSHPGFNEYDFYGLFNALTDEHSELKKALNANKREFPKALKQVLALWMEDKLNSSAPERWEEFCARIAAAREFINETPARKVLVVSSGGPIGTFVAMTMQTDTKMGMELNLQIRNCSYSHFFFSGTTFRLASFNSIPHLDHPERFSAITYG